MQNREIHLNDSYASALDAIVLAGTDTNPRRLIHGSNKAFLELGGQMLVRRVVEALEAASSIGTIFVVGPREQLQKTLEGLTAQIVIVEQAGNILANTWAGVEAAEALFLDRNGHHNPDQPMLFVSCDLPLISASALDDFVSRCAHEDNQRKNNYAMLAGITEEASLKPYYPAEGGVGIVRPCVHFDSGRMRLANIYVGRPRKLSHQEFLQTGFSYRKAKDWHNVVSLIWSFFKQAGGWKAAWLTARLQITLLASRHPGRLYRWLRKYNTAERIELSIGTVMGGEVRMVVTPYGGLSLDVDEEEDYRILGECYSQWSLIGPTPWNPGQSSNNS